MHLICTVFKPNSDSSDCFGFPAVAMLKSITLASKPEQIKTNQHPSKQIESLFIEIIKAMKQ